VPCATVELSANFRGSRCDFSQLSANFRGSRCDFSQLSANFRGSRCDFSQLSANFRGSRCDFTVSQLSANFRGSRCDFQPTFGKLSGITMRLQPAFGKLSGITMRLSANFRQTFGDHDATFSQLSGTKQQNCSCSMKSLLPSSLINLSSLYQQIRDQAIQTPHWPASQTISQAFECGNNVYHAPSFEDGNGPVALVALFSESENPSALPLIQNCLSQFDQFIQDLSAVATNSHTREDQSRNTEPNPKSILHLIDAKVPHICILVFQEHPSLLTPEQHIHWRSFDEAIVMLCPTIYRPKCSTTLRRALVCNWIPYCSLRMVP
jgi:hypothetical protein